jgi:hypothetical protein
MQNILWPKTIRRVLFIIFLFLALFIFADLLFVALLPLMDISEVSQPIVRRDWYDSHASAQQTEYWQDLFEDGPPVITRTIAISAAPTSVQVDLDLWLTRTHPCVWAITSGRLEDAVPQFAKCAFGNVRVDGIALSSEDYEDPLWNIDPTTQEMHVHLQAARRTDGYLWGDIDRLEGVSPRPLSDEFLMRLGGVRLTNISPTPDSANSELVVIREITPTVLGHIHYNTRPLSTADELESDRESSQAFLQRLGDLLDIPLVSSLLSGIIRVLPLLVFLCLIADQNSGESQFATKLIGVTLALVIFHLVIYLLDGSQSLTYRWRLFETLSSAVERWLSNYYPPRISPLLGHGPASVTPAVVGFLVPALLLRRFGAEVDRVKPIGGPIVRLISLALPSVGIVVALMYWQIEFDATGAPVSYGAVWTYMLLFGSVLYLLIWSTLEALSLLIWSTLGALSSNNLANRAPGPFIAPLTSLIIVITVAWDTYTLGSDKTQWGAIGWLLATMLLGTSLILSILMLVRHLVHAARAERLLKLRRDTTALVVVLVLMLAIPMQALVNPSWQLANIHSILGLAYPIDGFFLLIWFGGIVWMLYITRKETSEVDAFTRKLGVLAASSLFFSAQSHWLYIPITFLLGWQMLARLFVRPAGEWSSLEPLVQQVVEQRSELIDNILTLNAAEREYKGYQEKQREKLVNGEISFWEHKKNLKDRHRQLQRLREGYRIADRPAKDVALAFGPQRGAWENAVHGTKFALLFASPWIALALHDLLTGSPPKGFYPLWYLAYDVMTMVLKWGLYGFFFGYFYPYLRGKNGLQKGLWLFLAVVLPTLPLTAISNSSISDWQATLFWVLQVFIQCILLGLVAFDYVTLQRGGYRDWRLLFEVHDLPSVGISVSSILVAIGAAVTTLLTTQATNLVSLALRFVIPQIPTDLPVP